MDDSGLRSSWAMLAASWPVSASLLTRSTSSFISTSLVTSSKTMTTPRYSPASLRSWEALRLT